MIRESSGKVLRNLIQNNSSNGDGGGIYVHSSQLVSIVKNDIRGNKAAGDGGGVFAYGFRSTAAIDVSENLIYNNSCGGRGGGVFLSRSSALANKIFNNIASSDGGGIYSTYALVLDNEINRNKGKLGGGIFAEQNSSLLGNFITGNHGSDTLGGGVYLNFWGISVKNEIFENNLVTRNSATGPQDNGGVYVNGYMIFKNNNIFRNNGAQLFNGNSSDSEQLDVINNYWGTRSSKKIEEIIIDGKDDSGLGITNFEPFMKRPAEIVENRQRFM